MAQMAHRSRTASTNAGDTIRKDAGDAILDKLGGPRTQHGIAPSRRARSQCALGVVASARSGHRYAVIVLLARGVIKPRVPPYAVGQDREPRERT